MDLNVFLILILSHIVFDFVFQGNKILKLRFPERVGEAKSNAIKGNLIHSAIHFIGVYIITLLFSLISGHAISISFWAILIIIIFHFIIDEVKSNLYMKDALATMNIWVFLLDQLSHLLVILGVLKLIDKVSVINIFRDRIINNNFLSSEKALLFFIFIFIATWVTGIFIKILLGYLSKRNNLELNNYIESNIVSEDNNSNINLEEEDKDKEDKGALINDDLKGDIKEENILNQNINKEENIDEGAPNGGFIIGILERIFIVISIIIDYPMMIGFVLTVKSVARFKKLSNDSFAEYFIIGTFLSFIPAILVGLIIKWLII